ncbi:LysR family transcriptional regulator [Streptomyces sp. AC536]|uniref:LysR substrate-binding domain-containing protein n=1 Tax=Streptomyces buecherae TaxID=2763006 RepID=UPI00164D8A6F|nr:LysR family transcriptional regulator [Streptomyces buecherae]MBC3983052.1 LysR family transcriptional regulator [Streptomyces buecherae]QNJ39939.1 LysR family transcriptional regulator [Streptomyces buecherae]
MTLEIHDLRVLRAIATAGSLAGAARALGTHQASVSRRLQRIERSAGVTLFCRGPRGTTPTAAGRLVLGGADTLLPLVDWLLDAAAERATPWPGPGGPVDTVRVGAVGHPALPALVGALYALLPGAPLDVRTEESSAALLDLLRAQKVELALVRHFPCLDGPPPADVESAVVAHERLLVGLDEGHPLADRRSVTLRDLAPHTCVLVDSHHGTLRRRLLGAVGHSGVDLRLSRATDGAVAAAMVRAASAAVPTFPVPAPLPGVVFLPLDDDAARYTLLLAWARGGKLAAHGRQLAERARRAYPPAPTR